MPVGKRTTKVVSYNEQDDDDDDFITVIDNSKKNRKIKSNHTSTESKSISKQQPQKHDEKLCKSEQEEVNMIPQQPKKSPEKVPIENPIIIDDKENTNSQSTIFSNVDDVDENESKNEHEEEFDEEDETPSKISICKTEETIKKTEVPTISSMVLNKSAIEHRNLSTETSDPSKKRLSVPLGFPTSKINIPSQHVFRVGLSRKSSTIKPLHPNFTSRIVHE
ncbi:unnamed protein product [Rotaria sp. Silwood1]|nr:unnamed protein product [Rotaria sp. Silwood1]CAF3391876.1 unnamed protein product [Rotaria sp. Silwood1]CAF3417698.1 unnamed protein product [Rotaria sp. Silwood1]CAF4545520.1 unnamed protein product [Rotaria sp. Silwood1]CAF4784128.1 unnamed protein product [Rotaria sp. Silwood1]